MTTRHEMFRDDGRVVDKIKKAPFVYYFVEAQPMKYYPELLRKDTPRDFISVHNNFFYQFLLFISISVRQLKFYTRYFFFHLGANLKFFFFYYERIE